MAKKRRAVPNFFTIGNLIGGMLAIQFSLTGFIEWAPYCILAAIVFDFFDGFMAGILKVKSDKGKQMDSLADIVTFGVAPGFIVFTLLNTGLMHIGHLNVPVSDLLVEASEPLFKTSFYISDVYIGSEPLVQPEHNAGTDGIQADQISGLGWFLFVPYLAFLIPVFALFRLAKFNVDTEQTDSFLGVPTATMAIFFASFPLLIQDALRNSTTFKTDLVGSVLINPMSLIILTIVFSILMVTRIPLIALKFKTFGWKGNEIRFIFLALCLVSIILFKFWSIPVIVIIYILLSIVNNVATKSTAKK